MMHRPSDLHAFLSSLGIHPKKGLSQNFLIDGNILRKVSVLADIQPGDFVLEIGPGPGALTQILLENGAHVLAVEKDTILADALLRHQTADKRLEVVCADIMEFDIETELSHRLKKGTKAKVVANLPYHITTPILSLLVKRTNLFSTLIVMVQEEVARRFVAKFNTSDYGSFSVFLQFYTEPSYGFKVGRNCFYPAPAVDSAVVRLDLREPP